MDHIVFPKMTHEEHLKENMDVLNFRLTPEDVNAICGLNKDFRFYQCLPVPEYAFVPYFK
jgi:diketogulonate reductase-like aldo/keto reductase